MDATPPFFLYDGECGFCQKWMRWIARRVRDRIALIPSQSVDNLATFGLSDDDVRTASYWVDDGGVAHRGHSSIAHALQHADGPWRLVGVALELPLIRILAAATYRVVARNRHRLPAPGGS
ncbi:MAG: thiol-disulfide oxidoreductase DCC family protein [Acidimicrobiales bacterium]